MAYITLTTLWLNLASDPTQAWEFKTLSALTSVPVKNITSQQTADGNPFPGNVRTLVVTTSPDEAHSRARYGARWSPDS
jgi:hypothetical protein